MIEAGLEREGSEQGRVQGAIAVPSEVMPEERRVGLVPESVSKLVAAGFEVYVQSGAGQAGYYTDRQYRQAGAKIVNDRQALYASADIVVKVQRPLDEEVSLMKEGTVLIALLQPLYNPQLARHLAKRNITSFSMDAIPRIARAQSMDALSSMSSIAGYQAVLIAANAIGKYFPLMMTAAGTIPPARGLILGAGVAGLQAIATSRRLGAVVEAFDVRPAVKEQVESLGAKFVEVDYGESTEDTGGYARELTEDAQRRQWDKIHERLREMDFAITTALVPGRKAPRLITAKMVDDMKPGAVIVDLAAETGGNCELTKAGEMVEVNGVKIFGPLNLVSHMPATASQLYARNITNLLMHLVSSGQFTLDFDDAITAACCITHQGEIRHEATKEQLAKESVMASRR